MKIDGVRWEDRVRLGNGGDSHVVPFSTTRSTNLVYHGDAKFDYGHYGIHLGQEDRLTFLGPSSQTISASFIDCRSESPTRGKRDTMSFAPSSARTLCVPPGVAHSFDGLGGIHTINDYDLFLPDPEKWLSGESDWNPGADVINVPLDIAAGSEPSFVANSHRAADLFYALIAARQRTALDIEATGEQEQYDYPVTEDFSFRDGTTARLSLRRMRAQRLHDPSRAQAAFLVHGCRWEPMPWLSSGPNSGFVPLFEQRPFYVVDHGEVSYSHDAFGIHLGQEDHLVFLGPSDQRVQVELVDCRAGSSTLHHRENLAFVPSPHWQLVIPPGVAHRFSGLERVFTVNKPKIYFAEGREYLPGNDVIDWSIRRKDFPELVTNTIEAPAAYYLDQAREQARVLQDKEARSLATPMVFLTNDADGKPVRVALRKDLNAS